MLSSSSDEEDFFRAASDLKYSNIEWKDIQHTRLGRQLDDRINLQKGEIRNLHHKLKEEQKSHKQ